MNLWYLVLCKNGYNNQHLAEGNLLEQRFETFNPKIEIERIHRGIRTSNIEPAFLGYIFVRFDPTIQSARSINNTAGVRRLVTFGKGQQNTGLLPIAEGVINELKERFEHEAVPLIVAPEEGNVVRINKGPFTDLTAIFKEPCGKTRSILLISILGSVTEIEVKNTAFS